MTKFNVMVGQKCIVVIGGEMIIQQSITAILAKNRFDGFTYPDIETACNSGIIALSDAVILETEQAGFTGQRATAMIKKSNPEIPVILLSSVRSIEQLVNGFEEGADDYILKPFPPEEFIARLKAVLKRYALLHGRTETYEVDDLVIEMPGKKVTRNKKLIPLTSTEFNILLVMAREGGSPVTKKFLLSKIWNGRKNVNENTVEVYINFLRSKIDKPFHRNLIHTRPGFGYYLSEMK